MPEQLVHQSFIDSADLKYQWAPLLAAPIDEAVEVLLTCITSGGKLLCCGNGASGALAQYVAALLMGGLDRPRPELPALALGADAVTLTALANRGDFADGFAAQVRALGNMDDVLLVVSVTGQAVNLVRAVQEAQERDMTVLALTGQQGGELAGVLRDTDVHIEVPHTSTSRVLEAHQLVLHCLCQGLDQLLLGDEELPT